jgi:glycosyltransferase involved in cell wall biosynthesis
MALRNTEDRNMKISISIPTYNRLNFLIKAIEEIKKISDFEEIKLQLAISNIASEDGTSEYLESLKKEKINNLEISIFNNKRKEINSNWYYLNNIISNEIDWVWMHGDDDVIIDKDCISLLAPFLRDPTINFIIVPQVKRIGLQSPSHLTGTLQNMAESYGLHDLLGWVSQIIVRRQIYHSYAMHHFEITKNVNSREDFISKRYSSFPHVNYFFENFSQDKVILVYNKIIEEQVRPEDLNTHNAEPKHNRAFLEGVFFFGEQVARFLEKKNKKVPLKFFRYVNKNLIFLMLDMAINNRAMNGSRCVPLDAEYKIILQSLIRRVDEISFVRVALLLLECIEYYEPTKDMPSHIANLNSAIYNFEID